MTAQSLMETYSYWELLLAAILLVALVVVFFSITSPDYFKQRYELRGKYKTRLRKFIRRELDLMVNVCTQRAQAILDGATIECPGLCGLDSKRAQFYAYRNALRLAVKDFLMDDVIEALYENGFHHKTGESLKIYLSGRGAMFYAGIAEIMKEASDGFPIIRASGEVLYSVEESVAMYTEIVDKYNELSRDEDVEEEALSVRYSLRGRIADAKKRIGRSL